MLCYEYFYKIQNISTKYFLLHPYLKTPDFIWDRSLKVIIIHLTNNSLKYYVLGLILIS